VSMTAARGGRLLALLLAIFLLAACAVASAGQSVNLQVALRPEHLGAGTTMDFRFEIVTPPGRVPPPLTSVEFRYPANFGLLTSGLGLATCTTTTLEELGPEGCPAEAQMGFGSAVVEIPVGPEIVRETGYLTAWMAPPQDGHIALSFYAEGNTPILAQLIFPGLVLDAAQPFGGRLHTHIPIIPSLPEAPNAAVVRLRATIGPLDVTYYRHAGGRTLGYQPNGILLPKTCPHGGFPFEAAFSFLDGSRSAAHTRIACPPAH
jgi:hypothetical protein